MTGAKRRYSRQLAIVTAKVRAAGGLYALVERGRGVEPVEPKTQAPVSFLERYARPGDAHFIDAVCALAILQALTLELRDRVAAGEPSQSSIRRLLRVQFLKHRRSRSSKFLAAMLFDCGVDVAEYLDVPRHGASW